MTTKIEVDSSAINEILQGVVQAALLAALSNNSPKVIEALVTQALAAKGSYGGETVLKSALKEGLRIVVLNEVGNWMQKNEAIIREQVGRQVEAQLTPVMVADQVMDALTKIKMPLSLMKKSAASVDDSDEDNN